MMRSIEEMNDVVNVSDWSLTVTASGKVPG